MGDDKEHTPQAPADDRIGLTGSGEVREGTDMLVSSPFPSAPADMKLEAPSALAPTPIAADADAPPSE